MPTNVGGSTGPKNTHQTQDVDVSAEDDLTEELINEEKTQPQLPHGNVNSVPPQSRAGLVQQALDAANMGMKYLEYQLSDGTMVWFSASEIVSKFGTPGQKAQMAGMGSAPGPQQYYSGGGGGPGGGSNTRQFYSGPGGGTSANYYTGGGYGGGYGGYGSYAGYGPGNTLYDAMMGGQMQDDMYAQRSQLKKTEHEMRVKMQKVMLMILMGDVTGAMREMVFESERQNRMFNRLLVKQLNRVREAKSKILLAMGRKSPPRAHDNTNDAAGAARDQNRQAKYTQWVSVTTQLMSEVQQTERELLDLLSEGRRNINELWEAYSGLKEAESRTTRTVIQAFRG